MCITYINVYTICAHCEPHTVRCGMSDLMDCKRSDVTAFLCLGWCPTCYGTFTRRTKRGKRPKYPSPTAWLTVANYWAFKSIQGWERPVPASAIRRRDVDWPLALPYRRGVATDSSGLNYEERALRWALAQVRPDTVVLRTQFVDMAVPWGSRVAGLIREARHLTLTEWSAYPGKEDLLFDAVFGGYKFHAVRQEYFEVDAIGDSVPVWRPAHEQILPCKTVSVAGDPAIVRIGKVVNPVSVQS